MKKRILYLDLLRIFAIFSMILLHVSGSCWSTTDPSGLNWQTFNFYDSIVRFCVPIFVMISGVFFLDPAKNITLKELFNKKILRIVIAFIFWSIAYSMVDLVKDIINDRSISLETVKSFLSRSVYGHFHMWFLFMIVGLYIITPILRKISADRKTTEYFIILSFIFCYTLNILKLIPILYAPITKLTGNTQMHFIMGYTGYYLSGYYLHNNDLSKKTKTFLYIMAPLCVIFTIVGSSLWSVNTGSPKAGLYDYLLPGTFFSSTALFLLFKDKVSEIKISDKIQHRIQKLSSLMFGTYLVHAFAFIIMQKAGLTTLSFNPIFSVPVITIIIFSCSLFVTYVISKIPVLNKYVI